MATHLFTPAKFLGSVVQEVGDPVSEPGVGLPPHGVLERVVEAGVPGGLSEVLFNRCLVFWNRKALALSFSHYPTHLWP